MRIETSLLVECTLKHKAHDVENRDHVSDVSECEGGATEGAPHEDDRGQGLGALG